MVVSFLNSTLTKLPFLRAVCSCPVLRSIRTGEDGNVGQVKTGMLAADAPLSLDPMQQRALAQFYSGSNVAHFGQAGSGESEVRRRTLTSAMEKWGKDAVAVPALAGSAALLVGGQTLHSVFGMDTRPL